MNRKTVSSCLVALAAINIQVMCAGGQDRDNLPEIPDGVVFETDIQYREGHERWKLNVLHPERKSGQPRAAVVLVHGGGWRNGDHYGFTRMGLKFVEEGYVVILPTYRLMQDAAFPACLEDLKCAIRWTRANAEKYHIDPERIGAYGNSAGATQALTAALTNGMKEFEGDGPHEDFSSDLQAVAGSGAVGDMQHATHSRAAVFVYKGLAKGPDTDISDSKVRRVLATASPVTYVNKDAPPILLVHGAKDTVVVIDSTDEFVEAMKKAGADIEYMRYEDGTHGVMGQKGRETNPAMFKFFKKHL